MDLTFLKWPIIILVIVGLGWFATSGGMNYIHKQCTKAQVGEDPAKDKRDEARLSRCGGFLLLSFRAQKADGFFKTAIDRYPQGANVWCNKYRMVKCAEKAKQYQRAVNILQGLMNANAHSIDSRVPENANLKLRMDKHKEMYGLGEMR